MPRPPGQKTIVVELFVDMFLQTDGTTSYTYTEVEAPQLEALGPHIESMYVLTVTRNRTTNHSWTVGGATSNTGRNRSTPVPLFTDVVADGEVVQAAYTTVSTFGGLKFKTLVAAQNSTGSVRESAQVSAWLVIDLKT